MADRKQTPDVLSEILGGEPEAPRVPTASKPPAAAEAKPVARQRAQTRRASRPAKAKQSTWEYMEVVFRDYGGWRARFVNGEEQKGWKQAPTIRDYLNQVGADGWELAGLGGRHKNEMPAYFKRLKA